MSGPYRGALVNMPSETQPAFTASEFTL